MEYLRLQREVAPESGYRQNQKNIEHVGANNRADCHIRLALERTGDRRCKLGQTGAHRNDGQANDQLRDA